MQNTIWVFSSQFTNEELKLKHSNPSSKPSTMFAIYQWGVEMSWGILYWLKLVQGVRNLPMRSWNRIFKSRLWNLSHNLFAIYQWGVEIDSAWAEFRAKTISSQFTNEELKYISVMQYLYFCLAFAIYQWGVESLNFKSYGFGLGKNL